MLRVIQRSGSCLPPRRSPPTPRQNPPARGRDHAVQRHKHLAVPQPAHTHIVLNDGDAASVAVLIAQPLEDPLRRVPLLVGRQVHRRPVLSTCAPQHSFTSACQRPPRVVGMPRSFSAFAMPVALVTPSARIASNTGSKSAGSGCSLALPYFCRLLGPSSAFLRFSARPPSLTPRALAAAVRPWSARR